MSATVICNREVSDVNKAHKSLDMTDSKGRVIGVLVKTYTKTMTAAPAEQRHGYSAVPGVYYCADVIATRNSVRFGASNRDGVFSTLEERNEWIAKRIEDTRKRYAKLYAK